MANMSETSSQGRTSSGPLPLEPRSFTTQRYARRLEPVPPASFVKLWAALAFVWTLFVVGVTFEFSSDTINVSPVCEVTR